MSEGRILVQTHQLSLRRKGREILSDIDITLRAGERWLLWGDNGSGKTTLARALAGLLAPSAGELILAAELQAPLPLLFQDPDAQLAAATVRDEIALGAREKDEDFVRRDGEGPAAARIARALGDFRLTSFSRRNPHALSGGEKRRLGMAALSVLSSPVLILDEPELHLDEVSWTELRLRLDAWFARGEHALLEISRAPEALAAADKLALLHEGRLLAAGRPEEVLAALDGSGLSLPRLPAEAATAAATFAKPDPPQPGPTLLSARCLRLERPGGGTPVLDSLDLEIRTGERLLLLGENGSGKSSLLLLLADLADPDAGKLDRRSDLETGLAFQDPERVCFAETVAEEMAFGLRRRCPELDAEQVDQRGAKWLSAFGLDSERFGPRDPFTLSAGELRRLALACVAAVEPDLLILDEAAAALDDTGRSQLRAALAAWSGALLWADCRPPAGFEGFFHRRYGLTAGRLRDLEDSKRSGEART